MGYSISLEQSQKLERNKREGRLCAMGTGRGGCFTRATWVEDGESWYYEEDRAEGKPSHPMRHTVCGKHRMGAGYEGRNFVVHTSHKLPKLGQPDYWQQGYDNGVAGVPAPAPGFAPTAATRQAYMEGWRVGRAVAA